MSSQGILKSIKVVFSLLQKMLQLLPLLFQLLQLVLVHIRQADVIDLCQLSFAQHGTKLLHLLLLSNQLSLCVKLASSVTPRPA